MSTLSSSEYSFSEEFQIDDRAHKRIYGREKEVLILSESYDRLKIQNSFEIVFLHGKSGVGKTCVAMNLRDNVIDTDGFFCSAKYFQNLNFKVEPYAAIMSAFSDLCTLTLQSSDFNEDRRKEIQQVLWSNAEILMRSISNISPFLGNHHDMGIDEIKIDTTFAKFKVACKAFLRAMTSKEHPVVIFLDDIQWMDQPSKELLEFLLQDTELTNLMLVLAYRDEEVDSITDIFPNHSKSKTIEIPLRNLDLESIKQLIAANFGSNPSKVEDLAKMIARKTEGNPFHIYQFLKMLEVDGLIVYDDYFSSWVYDIKRIEKETMISDSLAEILSAKVRRLDIGTLEMLKIASLVGYAFPEDMIIELALEVFKKPKKKWGELNISKKKLQSLLVKATNDGLLNRINEQYQFSHDKIHTTFRKLFKKSEEERLHLKISRSFFRQNDDKAKYQTAIHLNRASSIHVERTGETPIYILEGGAEVAQMNLDAAKYCECRSAFLLAASLLQQGLAYINDETKWIENFDLSFEMTQMLAKMEFIAGNLEACKAANQEVYHRSRSIEMKIRALVLEVEVYSSLNDYSGVVKASKNVLKQLRVKLPRKITILNVLRKLIKVRSLLNHCNDEEIINQQETDDWKILIAIRVLMLTCFICVDEQDTVLALYLALTASELTMEHGLSLYSSIALYMYGITELFLGNRERGYRVGLLSLKLHSKLPCKDSGCAMVGGTTFYLICTKEKVKDYFELHWSALNEGFKVGDINSVTVCLANFFSSLLWSGENLASLEKKMLNLHSRIRDFGEAQSKNLRRINPIIQFVLNIRNQEEDEKNLTKLSGALMEEEDYLSKSMKDGYSWFTVFHKMILCYTFGFHREVVKLAARLSGTPFTKITYFSLPFHFYAAMASYRLYETTQSRHYLRRSRKYKKFFVREKSLGNPNANPHLCILEIEELFLRSKNLSEILEACNLSIWQQSKEGFRHLEAVANEQAYNIVKKLNFQMSRKYFDQALEAYACKWGATAKYRQLQEEKQSSKIWQNVRITEKDCLSPTKITLDITIDS